MLMIMLRLAHDHRLRVNGLELHNELFWLVGREAIQHSLPPHVSVFAKKIT